MNHSSQNSAKPWRKDYDLTIANVEAWRKERPASAVWTRNRTQIWENMRTAGERAVPRRDTYAQRWARIGNWIVRVFTVAAVAMLFVVAYNVISAFLSGRVQEVIDQIVRSHS